MHKSKINSVFSDLKPLASVFDELINEGISNVLGASFATFGPSVNIVDYEDKYVIELAVPGVTKSDFEMNLDQRTLTVSLKRDEESDEKDKKFIRREHRLTSFEKSFEIPENIDRDQITATYDNGVLHIALPSLKKEENEKARTIEIN